jgi:hypothetical protein
VGVYAIAAEVLAVDAVVTGEWEWWTEIFVALFVVGGMAGVVLALVRPWSIELKRKGDDGKHRAQQLKVTAFGVTGAIAIWGGIEMLSNVDRAGENQQLGAIVAEASQKTTEATAVENRTLALSIALARAKRQLMVATARDEGEAILKGFTVELSTLHAKLSEERRIEGALRKKLNELRLPEGSVASRG